MSIKMKSINSISELKSEFLKIKKGVASDTIFGAKALMFIAEKMDELVKLNGGNINGKGKRINQGNESKRRITSDSERKEDITSTNDESSMEIHKETQPTGQKGQTDNQSSGN